jgi:hypothetical protein
VPYQLHCEVPAHAEELELITELELELGTELDVFIELLLVVALLELVDTTELEVFTELLLETTELEDDVRTEEDDDVEAEVFTDDELLEDTLPPQTAPVTTGVSTAPLVSNCTPKDATCPGWRLPFQLKLVAL